MGYQARFGQFRIRLSQDDVKNKKTILKELLLLAYENSK